jgi:hypothetical protein
MGPKGLSKFEEEDMNMVVGLVEITPLRRLYSPPLFPVPFGLLYFIHLSPAAFFDCCLLKS